MKIKVVNFSRNNSLVTPILFLLLGILLLINPGWLIEFMTYILGGILITIGILNLIKCLKFQALSNYYLIIGILLIIVGVICIFGSSFIEILIRFIIGSAILFNGFSRLLNVSNKKYFIINLIASILLIACGLYTIFVANLVFMTIGIFIIFFSILKIIDYIRYSKNRDII